MNEDFGKRLANIIGKEEVVRSQAEAKIAAQITEARNKQKISQQKLADSIGVAKSTIGRIESGEVSPRASTLSKISKALGIRLVIDGTVINDDENAAVKLSNM